MSLTLLSLLTPLSEGVGEAVAKSHAPKILLLNGSYDRETQVRITFKFQQFHVSIYVGDGCNSSGGCFMLGPEQVINCQMCLLGLV